MQIVPISNVVQCNVTINRTKWRFFATKRLRPGPKWTWSIICSAVRITLLAYLIPESLKVKKQKKILFPFRELSILPMRVISRNKLKEFWLKHADSEPALKAWYYEARYTSWKSPKDVKQRYPSASLIPDNRIVFNIKGNRYRLIVKINYNQQIVFIRFIGTHAEYNLIDATTI